MNLALPNFNLNHNLANYPDKPEFSFGSLAPIVLPSSSLVDSSCNLFGNYADSIGSAVLLAFQVTESGTLEPILVDYQELCSFLIQEFRELTDQDQKKEDNLADNKGKKGRKKLQKNSQKKESGRTSFSEEQNDEINGLIVTIWKHFEHLDDPRADTNRWHELKDIVIIAILAIISGANNWVQIANFGKSKYKWLKTFLKLTNGIPSHDTFNRVFSRLDPDQFKAGFISWVKSISKIASGEVIAIDGKQNRRTHDKKLGKKAIHMVSAWATQNKLVLGQVKVNEKSNEITAIPELLEALYISGCIITIDAMGCQKKIAEKIIDKEANYVLALKNNHKNLYKEVTDIFDSLFKGESKEIKFDYFTTVDINHGRREVRECWTISISQIKISGSNQWKKFTTIAMVRDERIIGDKTEKADRFFISSLPSNAENILDAVRFHWSIENSLHWVLDMAFREDESRLRIGHGPENFAILRHIALNFIKQETSKNEGTQTKRLNAAWGEDYLLKILKCAK